MIVIVMGVSGSGKTTIGRLLAERLGCLRPLGCSFEDADDFHSAENKAKMHSGQPLDDHDRLPWLETLRLLIQERLEKNQDTVLACSALREAYRQLLLPRAGNQQPTGNQQRSRENDESAENGEPTGWPRDSRVLFLYLKASFEAISERLARRKHEFMNNDLLRSQFQTLEEPEDAIVVNTDGLTPDEVVDQAVGKIKSLVD